MNNEKVYVLYEEICDNTEPFMDDGNTKILLTTLNIEKALKMYKDKRTEKALELYDNVDWFNNALDEEEDGNYYTEFTAKDILVRLVVVEDYTYYILSLEERILE